MSCTKFKSLYFWHLQVTSFSNFYKGDPYTGSREEEMKKKNKEIDDLRREVKALKAEQGKSVRNDSYRPRYAPKPFILNDHQNFDSRNNFVSTQE